MSDEMSELGPARFLSLSMHREPLDHTCVVKQMVSEMTNQGKNYFYITEKLGWISLETVQIYTNIYICK